MSKTTDRPLVVEYRGRPIHLTREEYAALRAAAMADPVEADRLAREHLTREASA